MYLQENVFAKKVLNKIHRKYAYSAISIKVIVYSYVLIIH